MSPLLLLLSVCVLSVAVRSLPHIVYLSRGRMFEYSGSREAHDLTQFAHSKLNRHLQQQQQDEDGREVPAPPNTWSVLGEALLQWAGQLHHTVTSLPVVSAALVSVGVLLGVLLTLLFFALLLPNQLPAGRKAQPASAKLATSADGVSKPRKAD